MRTKGNDQRGRAQSAKHSDTKLWQCHVVEQPANRDEARAAHGSKRINAAEFTVTKLEVLPQLGTKQGNEPRLARTRGNAKQYAKTKKIWMRANKT